MRRPSPRRMAATLALGLLALAACSKASRPHVDRVVVDEFDGQAILGLTVEQLEARLRRALDAGRFVVMKPEDTAPDGATVWRVSLALNLVEPDPEEGPVGRVVAVLSLRQRGADESFEVQAHESKRAVSNRVEDIQEATGVALESVLARLVSESKALLDLLKASDAQLVDKLASGETPVKNAAVTLLARRQNPAALKPLLDRLSTEDLTEIRRVMGLLIELKDPKAVPALIDVSRARDNMVQREVVFALGAIGGDEAEAYLWSVAQGHDDPVVRASAEQALEELKSRQQGKAPK